MRKVSLRLFALLVLFTAVMSSCKKDKHEPIPDVPETPKTEIPDKFLGKWIIGNFNPAHFADYDGSATDLQTTIAYNFKKDGSAEEYIYYAYDDGSGKQTLTYRKGTVSFDAATSTLKFKPTEGRFRTFQNGNATESSVAADGLFPKYAPQYRNCSIQQQDNVTYLVGTSNQDNTIGFAKVNW